MAIVVSAGTILVLRAIAKWLAKQAAKKIAKDLLLDAIRGDKVAKGTAKRIERLEFNTERIAQTIRGAKTSAMTVVASEIEATLKRKVGRIGTSKLRSNPGESPRRQTGFLQQKIRVRYRTKEQKIVVSTPLYGVFLDKGAPSINLRKRPFITPTVIGDRRKWERRTRALMRRFAKTN